MKWHRAKSRRWLFLAVLLLLFLQVEGCYYTQAIRGHTDLMSRRRPVDEVISDDTLPEDLRVKLELVQDARGFAVSELLLPDNDSYRSYADLERDYVVWNVFAAPEFSLEPKTWCYPVAGCVAYRGYFSKASAQKLEEKLERQGLDVIVGGVAAYSTLGRFADPLLNTMMRWSEVDLVSTMFHELAHQKLYLKGDSAFNESFATAVAEIGIERWLERTGELDRLHLYHERKKLRRSMLELVGATRSELEVLYASGAEDDTKRVRKREILDTLSADADALIATKGGGIHNWLARPLNNAQLVSTNLYEGRVGAFKAILAECHDEMDCFYTRTASFKEMSVEERARGLDVLAD